MHSSLSRYSSTSKTTTTKNQMLWAWPSQHFLKKMPKLHFLTQACNSKKKKKKESNTVLWKWNVSGSTQVLKTANKSRKIGLFQKRIIAFEKLFLFWCQWLSRKTGRQNQIVLILLCFSIWDFLKSNLPNFLSGCSPDFFLIYKDDTQLFSSCQPEKKIWIEATLKNFR